jgi:hypothetical protein
VQALDISERSAERIDMPPVSDAGVNDTPNISCLPQK